MVLFGSFSDCNTALHSKETNELLTLPDDFNNEDANHDFKDIEVGG